MFLIYKKYIMTEYKIKENKEWVLKTVITQEVDIDLSQTLKNIRTTRAEFQKAWATLYEMSNAMDNYIKQHQAQNEFLAAVEWFLGEEYRLPELVNPYNTQEILKQFDEFISSEKERRADNLEEFTKEQWEK